jgi:hypothetical protein
MDSELPFTRRDGRLWLEDVELTGLAAMLDGRAAWLVSHAAVEEALSREAPARCMEVAAVGPLAVLAQLCAAGWWARARSSHELTLALAAGFPPERLVAGGGVRDDGFVKDALAAGVAVMEHDDASERANAARIAALLDHVLPPESGAPPDARTGWLEHCGGLLAPVLRPPPGLAVDATLPAGARVAAGGCVLALAWPADGPDLVPGSVQGLGSGQPPRPALVPAHLVRGDWVVLPAAAVDVHPFSLAHPATRCLLVREASWRLLEPRPLPLEQDRTERSRIGRLAQRVRWADASGATAAE